MKNVAFYTLGCKLNQAETAILSKQFSDAGYGIVSVNENPDVIIINTCTVTERSAAKSRKTARKLARENPDSIIILTGCYPQVSSEEAKSIAGVDYIFGTDEKLDIIDFVRNFSKQKKPQVRITKRDEIVSIRTGEARFLNNTRAFLKIQDGCDSFCSYCIVPYTRGSSRSVPAEKIVEYAKKLFDSGYKEIVLTGVHIGKWASPDNRGRGLAYLLDRLLKIEFDGRIRLSSLEPEEITDELLDTVMSDERVCRHFHISLQSASDTVLSRMNRVYTQERVQSRIDAIIKRFPDAGLGCDVIAGFPGESEQEFNETRKFLQDNPFSYFHVFPYSIRKGTEAAGFTPQIASSVKKERASVLRKIGDQKKLQFAQKWINKKVSVLIEERNSSNKMSGFTSEYLRVDLPYEKDLLNSMVPVKVLSAEKEKTSGKVV